MTGFDVGIGGGATTNRFGIKVRDEAVWLTGFVSGRSALFGRKHAGSFMAEAIQDDAEMGSGSLQHSFFHCLGQADGHKVLQRVKIIFTGFIGDADLPMLGSYVIGNYAVDFPKLKRCRVAFVLDANHKF
jgi:hypothetical protein